MLRGAACFLLGVPLLPAGDADLVCFGTQVESGVFLYPGEIQQRTVAFSWAGPGDFRTSEGSSSCHCIQVLQTPPLLSPAATAQAHVAIFGRATEEASTVRVWLIGEANGVRGYLEQALTFEVRDYLSWPEPGEVWDIGDIAPARLPARTSWTITRGSHPQPWERMEIERDLDGRDDGSSMQATVAPAAGGTGYALVVEVPATAAMSLGPLSCRLAWRFVHGAEICPYHPGRTIRANIHGDRIAVPSAILFGGMRPGMVCSQSCEVRSDSGGRLPAIAAMTTSDPGMVQGECTLLDDGGFAVQLACHAGEGNRAINGIATIRFVDGVSLRIPYVGRIAGR